MNFLVGPVSIFTRSFRFDTLLGDEEIQIGENKPDISIFYILWFYKIKVLNGILWIQTKDSSLFTVCLFL